MENNPIFFSRSVYKNNDVEILGFTNSRRVLSRNVSEKTMNGETWTNHQIIHFQTSYLVCVE